ncbi:hypothetical protein H8K38_11640 [Undibacterium sp. FT79W]|uniref:hypothetical protein n=1 Tax=Undibacterium sp. FT79W TaxID=2762296 RepID=UPI00164AE3E5|nr:hypothetical protein [Undibacterium sp. FT79W]MBC3878465.1 hypothetical protein [Undibacterium sp. FT79W]
MAASKNSGVIVAESTSATDNNNQQYESEWRYHTTPPTRQLLDLRFNQRCCFTVQNRLIVKIAPSDSANAEN